MSFANLKKSRLDASALQAKLQKLDKPTYEADDRYWQPTVDKAGLSSTRVRLLPLGPADFGKLDQPWVEIFSHSFDRNGKWYIENCRTTLGKNEKDPVVEYNNHLYETLGKEAASVEVSGDPKRKIKGTKRARHFIVGIEVIDDVNKPENNGRVMLWKFGPMIMDIIKASNTPDTDVDPDAVGINPFDFWEGADFIVKTHYNNSKQRQYTNSKFAKPSVHKKGDDAALEALWNSQHSLLAEIAPDKFKSYEDLKKRLNHVLGESNPNATSTVEEKVASEPSFKTKAPSFAKKTEEKDDTPWNEDEEEGMGFFEKLANQ